MAHLLAVKELVDLRGILGGRLRVSNVEKVANLEVASKDLHSVFAAFLHLVGNLIHSLLGEHGKKLPLFLFTIIDLSTRLQIK
jgi:hypothetical protein